MRVGVAVVAPLNDGEAPRVDTLWMLERAAIKQILAACEGNITRAAERLGIHRQVLQRKISRFRLNGSNP